MLQYISPETEVMYLDPYTLIPSSDGGMEEGGEV